ncbi:MAG: O-antigen ligase family protein [Phycisphaerales bacterium]
MKLRLDWHPYLDPRRVEHDLVGAAVRDPVGHWVHLALAVGFCFFLPWPTSFVDIASIPVAVFSLIRLPNIWRTWGSLAVQPVFLGLVAWAVWQALSLLWSADPRQGMKELEANRWIGVVWALWPVMMHRRWLIAAVAAGFLCGNLSQVAQALAPHLGWDWLPIRRMPGRLSGWWDPVVGGSLLCGALGLHIAAAAWGRGAWRAVGGAGAAATAVAIAATGTRGAWIAGAVLLAGGLAAMVVRSLRGGGERAGVGRVVLTTAALAAACAAGWIALRGPVMARAERAREEIAAARRGDYATDTGARILMAEWALRAVRERPVAGVGAGGYRAWVLAEMRKGGSAEPNAPIHVHAHSTPLHIGATLGVVGVGIGVFIVGAAMGACRSQRTGSESRGTRGGAYDAGPLWALAGLLLAGLFDVVHLNAQTAAMLGMLLALCLVSRPREWDGLRPPAALPTAP